MGAVIEFLLLTSGLYIIAGLGVMTTLSFFGTWTVGVVSDKQPTKLQLAVAAVCMFMLMVLMWPKLLAALAQRR